MIYEAELYDQQQNRVKTFRALPISSTCPYVALVFNPWAQSLSVFLKYKEVKPESIHKVQSDGSPKYIVKNGQRQLVYERHFIESPHEVFIQDKKDIERLLEEFCIISNDNRKLIDECYNYKVPVPEEVKREIPKEDVEAFKNAQLTKKKVTVKDKKQKKNYNLEIDNNSDENPPLSKK